MLRSNFVSMKIKVIKTIFIVLLFLFFASWFYRIIMLMLLACVWREEIKRYRTWGYKVVIGCLLVTLFCVLPRYRYNTNDRVRLIYQDEKGSPQLPPLTHYLFNVVFPEEELCNLGIWCARIAPKLLPLSDNLLGDFRQDDRIGNIQNFYRPFRRLNRSGLFMMSGTTSQAFYMYGIDDTQSVYVIEPKHYDEKKEYPVVFFMHGYMGNWKLYTGLLKDLEDCIVLCVGTKDWSGRFTKKDVNNLFTKQIPFLESLDYRIDKDQLHIIGLSNGGTATNVAYKSFADKFKTITFISTNINQTYPISSKVLFIGGGDDYFATSLLNAYHKLKKNGTQTDIFWDDKETHFIMVNKMDEVINFINKNLK